MTRRNSLFDRFSGVVVRDLNGGAGNAVESGERSRRNKSGGDAEGDGRELGDEGAGSFSF